MSRDYASSLESVRTAMRELERANLDATLVYLRRRYTADRLYNDEVDPKVQQGRLALGCELDRRRAQLASGRVD